VIFNLSTKYPSCWVHANIKKVVIPKLVTTLKNAGFGSNKYLYQNVIKLVSVLPIFKLDDRSQGSVADKLNTMRQVFNGMFDAVTNDEAGAYYE
jgi:hypothetical protein